MGKSVIMLEHEVKVLARYAKACFEWQNAMKRAEVTSRKHDAFKEAERWRGEMESALKDALPLFAQ